MKVYLVKMINRETSYEHNTNYISQQGPPYWCHVFPHLNEKSTSTASLLHLADVRFRKVVVDQQPVMTSKDLHLCKSHVECDMATSEKSNNYLDVLNLLRLSFKHMIQLSAVKLEEVVDILPV